MPPLFLGLLVFSSFLSSISSPWLWHFLLVKGFLVDFLTLVILGATLISMVLCEQWYAKMCQRTPLDAAVERATSCSRLMFLTEQRGYKHESKIDFTVRLNSPLLLMETEWAECVVSMLAWMALSNFRLIAMLVLVLSFNKRKCFSKLTRRKSSLACIIITRWMLLGWVFSVPVLQSPCSCHDNDIWLQLLFLVKTPS